MLITSIVLESLGQRTIAFHCTFAEESTEEIRLTVKASAPFALWYGAQYVVYSLSPFLNSSLKESHRLSQLTRANALQLRRKV